MERSGKMIIINKSSDFTKYYIQHRKEKDQMFDTFYDEFTKEDTSMPVRLELIQKLIRETMPKKEEVASIELYTDEYIRLFEGILKDYRKFLT
jgi:hypothetical protein